MAIHYQEPLDRTFHALGDGTRRHILSLLATEGISSASELCATFDASQPTISKHLKVLELAGLVKRNVQGRTHQFELVTTPMDEAEAWLSRHKQFWHGTLDQLEVFLSDTDSRQGISDSDVTTKNKNKNKKQGKRRGKHR